MQKNSEVTLIDILTKAMDKVSQTDSNQEINNIIEKLLIDFTDAEFATLLVFDKEKQVLYREDDSEVLILPINHPESLLNECFLTKKPAIYNHVTSEKYYNIDIDNPKRRVRLKSQIIIPILDNDNLVGIVRTSKSIRFPKNYNHNDLSKIKSINSFLIKMINILSGKKIKNKEIDKSRISKELNEIKAQKENNLNEISETMMFLSNTVHDIRTPANTLYGFLDLIEEQIEDKRLKEFISNAKDSAKFINKLTDSILEKVKKEHEVSSSESTVILSSKFFVDIANVFSANMFKKYINYIIYIDPLIPSEIKIEELKLKRVIINLIGNAYKFTPRDKHIEFKVMFNTLNQRLEISVADTGIGIEKSRQKAIFKAFEQAQADTSAHFGGTGLGLAISSKYVKDLGGNLKLDSAIDKGSKFYFDMPLTVVDNTPSYEKFEDIEKRVTILTDYIDSFDAKNIKKYILNLGMPSDRIIISSNIEYNTTHLFCFEHKITEDILDKFSNNNLNLVVIEEKLFSLSNDLRLSNFDIISTNTYYGDKIHHSLFSRNATKVLIADDNKINIMLLQSILEKEYCDISYVLDGQKALDKLKSSLIDNKPYDILFLDKHMPHVSGTDVLKEYKKLEQKSSKKRIFTISITGDPLIDEEEKNLYDLLISKPFNKSEIREAFAKGK